MTGATALRNAASAAAAGGAGGRALPFVPYVSTVSRTNACQPASPGARRLTTAVAQLRALSKSDLSSRRRLRPARTPRHSARLIFLHACARRLTTEAVGELRALIDSDLSSSAAVAGAMGAMVLRVLQAVAELIREPKPRHAGPRAAGAAGAASPAQGWGQGAPVRAAPAGASGPLPSMVGGRLVCWFGLWLRGACRCCLMRGRSQEAATRGWFFCRCAMHLKSAHVVYLPEIYLVSRQVSCFFLHITFSLPYWGCFKSRPF